MHYLRNILLGLAFMLVSFPAFAHDHSEIKVGDLVIIQPEIRATPKTSPVSAGYLKIRNTGSEDDTLVSASAEFAGMTQLHRMEVVDGIARMREQEGGIVIPAGAEVLLENGGLHIMFMQLKEPMQAGEARKVVLTFEKAGEVELEMGVVAIDGKDDHSGHSHEGHGEEAKKHEH